MQVDSLPAESQGKPKNTGVGRLSLLQGIFPTQESNQGLLHCRQMLYQLSYVGSPIYILVIGAFYFCFPLPPLNTVRIYACAHTHTHTHTHTYTHTHTKPMAGHYRLKPLLETPRLSQAGLAQSLLGSLRPSPLICTRSCLCLQESLLPPVLWKSCNEIPVTFKVRFLGESESPCQILGLGSLLWGLEPVQQ